MRFYADIVEARDPREIQVELAELERRRRDASAAQAFSVALEVACDGLILAGMVEQAVADGLGASDSASTTPAAAEALTDWWADRLARPAGPDAEAPPMPVLPDLDLAPMVLPEGYAFYALFPEAYLEAGQVLATDWGGKPLVVTGVRSIGTSLSAAFAAGARRAGCPTRRHTVRPTGDPFQREVAASQDSVWWREAARRGAMFAAVDEGPGVSGSSLASVIAAYRRAGVEPERTHLICAHSPGALPHATDPTRAIWGATAAHPVQPAIDNLLQARLPALLAEAISTPLAYRDDLSWGRWNPGGVVLLASMERRKLLLYQGHADVGRCATHRGGYPGRGIKQSGVPICGSRDGSPSGDTDGEMVAKFIGFGAVGRRKAELARMLSEEGMTPAYQGFAHGFLIQRREGEPLPEKLDRAARAWLIDQAGRYYGTIRRRHAITQSLDLADLVATVQAISRDWLGDRHAEAVDRLAHQARAAGLQALQGDQKPERVEWRRAGNRLLKCDAADHYLDHSWARAMDSAFDLAGFVEEWDLASDEQTHLLAAYGQASGDDSAARRIPFFRCVYTAHRLALLDTAYHAGMSADTPALEAARQTMGCRLAAALREEPCPPYA